MHRACWLICFDDAGRIELLMAVEAHTTAHGFKRLVAETMADLAARGFAVQRLKPKRREPPSGAEARGAL